ncbi:MAG: RdgB/HAM1 family non-canonical purine NTP pyrophosphatase [Micavibrio aeruginosavorus]|nr:RdgB/HAM1 family non-canonical purine NTP pyrophosphatase [Micavibrio aeruginosavorus]
MTPITEIVLATHNPGKVAEIGALLEPLGIKVVSAGDLGLPEPEETGTSFAENAALKAMLAAQASRLPALADDSGLCVNALNGEPGIFSARWAGPEKDFNRAMQAVHDRMGDNPDRGAAFVCVLALAFPGGDCEIFEGRVDGTLVWPPMGQGGFGYDPMFMPEDYNRTFGEMPASEKKKISHRSRAFAKLLMALSASS